MDRFTEEGSAELARNARIFRERRDEEAGRLAAEMAPRVLTAHAAFARAPIETELARQCVARRNGSLRRRLEGGR
jgi:hypothetical protein